LKIAESLRAPDFSAEGAALSRDRITFLDLAATFMNVALICGASCG